jgi:hypothetical protein
VKSNRSAPRISPRIGERINARSKRSWIAAIGIVAGSLFVACVSGRPIPIINLAEANLKLVNGTYEGKWTEGKTQMPLRMSLSTEANVVRGTFEWTTALRSIKGSLTGEPRNGKLLLSATSLSGTFELTVRCAPSVKFESGGTMSGVKILEGIATYTSESEVRTANIYLAHWDFGLKACELRAGQDSTEGRGRLTVKTAGVALSNRASRSD